MSPALSPADDRLAALLAEYLRAVDSGHVPDLGTLQSRHPDLAGELESFVEATRHIEGLARPLQSLLRPADETASHSPRDTADLSPATPPAAPPPERLGAYEVLG